MVTATSSARHRAVERAARPVVERRHLLEAWHGAHRRPVPLVGDGLVAALVAFAWLGSAPRALETAALLVAAGLVFGLYRPRTLLETQGVAWYPRRALPAGAAVVVLLVAAHGVGGGRAVAIATTAVATLTALRGLLWITISFGRRRGRGLRPTLVVGPAARVSEVEHRIRTYKEAGLCHLASHTPAGPGQHPPADGRALVDHLLGAYPVDQVLFLVDTIDAAVYRDFVRYADDRAECGLVLPVPGVAAQQTRAHLGDLPVIPIRTSSSSGSDLAKRLLDLLGASLGLLVLSPLLAIVALAIRLDSRGPALFRQTRVGRDGGPFTIVKFRSMVVNAEDRRDEHAASNINPEGLLFKLENDPRITRVGAIIRRLSIDELPQLWNVLRGTMSLVGPRPLPVDPDEFDVAAQIRHRVAPGITGLWQVHGANALPYADMLDLDLTYVTTRTMGLDLVLLARTLPAIVFRRVKAY